MHKRLIIFTCYFRPICLPPKDEDFLEAGDSGKYIFAGLGHTSDYYTKYEDITGELIGERIEVMDFESLIALMEAKVTNSKNIYRD